MMKTQANNTIKMLLLIILILAAASYGVENQITSVSPSTADPGTTGLTVTFTLDTDSPPAPPAGAMPDSVTIGGIAGTSVTHSSQYVISAVFDIPADEAAGNKNVNITFTTPQGDSLVFSVTGGFTVNGDVTPTTPPYEGYNLFAPIQSTDTYLMDNDGTIVKTWTSSYNPGLSVYLLEDGTLLRAANTGDSNFNVGGAGGRVEQYDWNNNLIWSYDYSSTEHRQHHDIEMLPNGNVLMIAWEYKSEADITAAGGDLSVHTAGELWPDHIIEVQPGGSGGGTVVWEWHVWDHLIQDHDAAKPNYGVVADHPEKIDLNYAMNGDADWTHINSVDYNAELDQILLSVHNFSEIWIIDHNTTTAEAAGSAGDLLYRWGNPQAYDRGTATDQQLFSQHDAEWIISGLPGEGDILIFNNGAGRTGGNYSSVDQVTPPVNPDGSYTLGAGSAYDPAGLTWTYPETADTSFYAQNISGAQRLANGDTLICDGPAGYFFEVNSEGVVVWDYNYGSGTFRVERYGTDYAGFVGTELEPPTLPESGYPIVDTGQVKYYDDVAEITAPAEGEAFYGQDSQINGNQPSYTLSNDGLTVTDNVTGLIWTQTADINGDGVINVDDKLYYSEALTYADDVLNPQNYGGYNDWRLPSIKEIYSLMNFTGTDPSASMSGAIPFIDTNYFGFGYGDTNAGEREIDAQWATTTLYESTTIGGNATMFGLNLADGRIKGYPRDNKLFYVYFVRGNTDYGVNNFVDNGDGTISDKATGLMWSQDDCGPVNGSGPRSGMDWAEALAWVQTKNAESYLGYSDWRLPNAKEMQCIIDYTRCPDTGSAAIDPIFNVTQITNENGLVDYPWYWTSTTHVSSGGSAQAGVYFCFGRALGYWQSQWEDVHGAGCQRSDSKTGDLSTMSGYVYVSDGYYFNMAPQGDAARIDNYVRLVRDTGCGEPGYVSTLDGDLNGDCYVNLLDIQKLGQNWQATYDMSTLSLIADNWLSCNAPECL